MATTAQLNACAVGTACTGCYRRLPLRFSEQGEQAALWKCTGCGESFAGILVPEMVTLLSQRIRLAPRHLCVENVEPLPLNHQQVVERLHAAEPIEGVRELRRSNRLAGMRPAVAAFLNPRQGISGSAQHCTIANLSTHGMLIVTGVPVHTKSIIVQTKLSRREVQLLADTVWTRHLGDGCYGTGAELIAKFG